jgi:hypothetical protein
VVRVHSCTSEIKSLEHSRSSAQFRKRQWDANRIQRGAIEGLRRARIAVFNNKCAPAAARVPQTGAQLISVFATLNVRGLSLPNRTCGFRAAPSDQLLVSLHCAVVNRLSPRDRVLCTTARDRAGFLISHPVRRDRPSCRRQLFSTAAWTTCPKVQLVRPTRALRPTL